MAVFDAVEVADMKVTVNESLVDACTIERATPTSDGQGGSIDTWTNLATAVACRVRNAGAGTESVIADRLTAVVPWAIVLPAGQDVTVRDRILVTSQIPQRRFEVLAVLAPDSIEVGRTVLCEEVMP